ncbi:MAG: alpha/beta hydrolase [Phenylobacterium sp.]
MTALKEWWDGGRFVQLGGHRYFTRVGGDGPTLVFLHGFPTSSHDWAEVIAELMPGFRCVTFDYLGHGASDKPPGADYSALVQTDRALAVLDALEVRGATVVAHDLGGILLQEILRRHGEGRLALALDGAIFVNSSVYADLYRPTPAQTVLADPEEGPRLARQINRQVFEASMRALFPHAPPTPERFDDLWAAVDRDDGRLLWTRQLVYMAERGRLGAAWEAALEAASTPLGFIYGLADPISGAQILERVAERLPAARRVGLDRLGHFPQVEAPAAVAAALRSILEAR